MPLVPEMLLLAARLRVETPRLGRQLEEDGTTRLVDGEVLLTGSASKHAELAAAVLRVGALWPEPLLARPEAVTSPTRRPGHRSGPSFAARARYPGYTLAAIGLMAPPWK